jgi:hypothetical protein
MVGDAPQTGVRRLGAATIHPIHDKVLAFIRDPAKADFETLALEVFAHQFDHIAAYRRVCEQRGKTPGTVRTWRDVPAVPTLAFTHLELRCGIAERTFVTSGTTPGAARRGRHAMPDLRLYHAAAVAGLKEFVFPDVERMRILSLIPAAAERPDSSLAQMVEWAVDAFGRPGSAVFVTAERFDFAGFAAAVRQSESDGSPVCIMATTGALIRFLDRCRDHDWSFRLPHSSRLMDTGGSKGAPRSLSRNGLLQAIWNVFAIPGYFVANEYGMTELSSQFYDNVIRDRYRGRFTRRAKAGMHWQRTLALDPATLHAVPLGDSGLLCHVDLANAGTALSVLTEDVGRLSGEGVDLLGRISGADARGCSLALADFVG